MNNSKLDYLRKELGKALAIREDAKRTVLQIEKMIADIEKDIGEIENPPIESTGICEYNIGCGWSKAICGNDLPCENIAI